MRQKREQYEAPALSVPFLILIIWCHLFDKLKRGSHWKDCHFRQLLPNIMTKVFRQTITPTSRANYEGCGKGKVDIFRNEIDLMIAKLLKRSALSCVTNQPTLLSMDIV